MKMHEFLEISKIILTIVENFFIVYLICYSTFLFFSAIIGSVTLYKKRYDKVMHNTIDHKYNLPISILVPAFNEEKIILDNVKSLLNLDYKDYEIIIINDGSTDDTKEKLIEEFKLEKASIPYKRELKTINIKDTYISLKHKVPIILIDKNNSGKSDSLNVGINFSTYPYFVTVDADSILQKDSLEMIAKPVLEDENVIAVGGLVRISNNVVFENGEVKEYSIPNNLLVGMQILEYDRSFLASKILLDKFNGNLIISGAFGLFKKDYVLAVGGYDANTVGEDMELVVKLHTFANANKLDYKIVYGPEAICWTQVPRTLCDLIKQRRRWYMGLFQTLFKYKKILLNKDYGLIGSLSYVYFLFYELLSPFIEIFGLAVTVLAHFIGLLNMKYMLLLYGVYCLFGVLLSITTFIARIHLHQIKVSLSDFIKSIFMSICEVCFLRMLFSFVRLTSFIGYKKKRLKWGEIERNEMENKS